MKSSREMSIAMPWLVVLQLLLLLLTSSVLIVSASETLSGSFGVRHPPGVDRRSGDRVVFESAPPGPRLSRGSASKNSPDCKKEKSNNRSHGKKQTRSPGDDVQVDDAAAVRRVPVGAPPPPKINRRITSPPPPPPSEHR